MEKTLTVTGHSEIPVKVDTVVLSIHIQRKDKDYSSLLEEMNSVTLKLKDIVKNIDIKEANLKTENYLIETLTKQIKDENGNYKRVSDGYQACLDSQLRIPFYNALLSKALLEISSFKSDITLSYEVRDEKPFEELALIRCSKDALDKAKILADVCKVKIKNILSIQYQDSSDSYYGYHSLSEQRGIMTTSLDISPKDVMIKKDVTIIFQIEEENGFSL